MATAKRISRRRFLAVGGAGVVVLACGGMASVASSTSAQDFGNSVFEKESKVKKVLIAYASRCGSTAEVAKAIGARLSERGEAVDVLSVEMVKDLSAYRAVVVGSAIRMGAWLPAATKFVEGQKAALSQMPVAFFSVHMLALDDSEKSRQDRAAYTAPVRKLVTPQQETFFAGKIDSGQLGFVERLMAKAAKTADGDYRNWQTIQTWADQVLLS